MINRFNSRQTSVALLVFSVAFLTAIAVLGYVFKDAALVADFSRKDLPPGADYLFGTDWLGRDMFMRTICGLSMSLRIGVLTASVSAVIALCLGALASASKAADSVVTWVIDLLMGIPHILLLILISFACGKGFWGIVIGVTVTHWMGLARVMRGEILQLKQSGFVLVAEKLGATPLTILRRHLLPHLLPQFVVGLVLLFPHAILHEAAVTFLGFGLSPEQPAIGIILSESMRYLAMGKWWLALFPGAMLVFTVILFDVAGANLRMLTSAREAHR